ncbi:MAG: IPExxxVDY family protein [Bacteroidota bacterium]
MQKLILPFSGVAKKTLQSDNNYTYRVLGLISSAKDYRICHYINKELEFKFGAQEDISIKQNKETRPFIIKPYTYIPEKSIAKYFFINNKNDNELFIKKLKEIDYFILVEGEILRTEWSFLNKKLKNIDIIQHIMEIEIKYFSAIEHLIFETK